MNLSHLAGFCSNVYLKLCKSVSNNDTNYASAKHYNLNNWFIYMCAQSRKIEPI